MQEPKQLEPTTALEAHYQFLLWLVPTLEKFPRSQKFLLADRIQTSALIVLETLIEATYQRTRKALLASANLYQRRKKLTLFSPFCVSRQKRFAFRLRRGLRLYPEALSRYSRGRYGGRSRGPYTSDH